VATATANVPRSVVIASIRLMAPPGAGRERRHPIEQPGEIVEAIANCPSLLYERSRPHRPPYRVANFRP
jgi:hypothetical protein